MMTPIGKRSISGIFLLTLFMAISTAANARVSVGQPAPDFTAVDSNGKQHRLSDFKGKTLVLEWTNHDCPYVRKHYNTGNMQAQQRAATADGVVWLSIISSAPGKQGHVAAAEADALTTRRDAAPTAVLIDESGAIGRAYKARTTPHMYVIDATGEVGAGRTVALAARQTLDQELHLVRESEIGDVSRPEVAEAELARDNKSQLLRNKVTDEEIAEVVSKWTGIPVSKMLEGERDKLLRMEEELGRGAIGQRQTGDHFGTTAVHLERTNGGGEYRDMRFQSAVTAFYVPEFFKADVGCKARFGHVVVEQLQADPIGDDRALADGDVGEGTGVDQRGLTLDGLEEVRVDGPGHEGCHGAAHFQVAGGHGFGGLVEGHRDFIHALAQIGQVSYHGQDGHELGTDGDAELALHGVAVEPSAEADDDVAQGLGAEVDDPAHLHAGGIDIQARHAGEPLQLFIGIVALVLHACG